MSRRIATALAVCLVCLLGAFGTGCGTVANLKSGDPTVYGGIDKDVVFMEKYSQKAVPGKGQIVVLGCWFADLCLTGVTDTLTIPAVLCMQARMDREAWAASANRNPETTPIDGPVQYSSNIPEDAVAQQ
jgi:hypothetical protein